MMMIIIKLILLIISLSLCLIGAEMFISSSYEIIKNNALISGSLLFTIGFISTLYIR